MEKEMITAEDIILKLQLEHSGHYCSEEVKKAMIEFAKLHVKAALKCCLNKYNHSSEENYYLRNIEIMNYYPLTNIE